MAIADIQAQLANLTSQMTQYIDRTTMQGYQANQRPQRGWESVSTWGYQAPNQSRNDLFSNTYNSDWSDHSNSMWLEPQTYWQPYESYSSPTQPPQPHIQYAQPNPGSSKDYNQILEELISLVQGSQNPAKEAQQEAWQPYEEFYSMPMQSPQPPPQQFQMNSGLSSDSDTILQILTSLTQGQENQAKEMENLTKELSELKNPKREFVEFMAQVQEQSELSDSIVEIAEPITLGSDMEVGAEPKTSNPSQDMDDQLLFEEEEDDIAMAREEPPLPHPHMPSMPSTTTKVSPNSIFSDFIPPNVPIPCRSLQSKKEVAGECLEFIKKDVVEATIPKEVGFHDTGQVTTLNTPILAEISSPKTVEGVFILEFTSEHTGKPPPRISISFYTNLLLMIQASTQEFKPLPDHFHYHLPFKDKGGIVRLEDVKASASWEATHAQICVS